MKIMIQKSGHVVLFYPGQFFDGANGSQVRTISLLNWLRANFERVTLYAIDGYPNEFAAEDLRAALASFCPDVELVVEDRSRLLGWVCRLKKILQVIIPSFSSTVMRMRIPGLTPKWERLTAIEHAPLIYVNYFNTLFLLNGTDPSRCVVETHDIQFFRKAKGPGRSPLSLRGLARLRMEFGVLRDVAGAIGISRYEAYLIRNMAPETAVFYIPDYEKRPPKRLPLKTVSWDLLFVGSSNVINERGLIELFDRPDLDLSAYRIAICGSVCNLPSIKTIAAKHKNVQLLGFVDELEPIYSRSKACLAPTDGTGLNIKIVEALRYGRPVFASRSAMEALTIGFEECVFPFDNAALSRLLLDPIRWSHASPAAADFYQRFVDEGELGGLSEWARSRVVNRMANRVFDEDSCSPKCARLVE